MSTLKATNIKNESSASNNIVLDSGGGVVVSGILTATTFSGNVTGNVTIGAGSTSAPSLAPSGDSNTGVFFPSADTIAFAEGGTEVARFDSSGRLGLGIASPTETLHVSGDVRLGTGIGIGQTIYFSRSGQTDAARIACDSSSNLQLWTSTSERARIDSSGNLGIGTANPGNTLHVFKSGDGQTPVRFQTGNANGNLYFYNDSNGWSLDANGEIRFVTNRSSSGAPARVKIETSGRVCMGPENAGSVLSVSASQSAGTSYAVFTGSHTGTGPGDGTISIRIWNNGNIQNSNGSYTSLSDAKLKENIVDAGSQWDDLKAIQIRNWNFKSETGQETHTQIGPIAQELEEVCPGLVFDTPDRDAEGNDLGTVTKGINQSVLYMKAVKALQEAQERIETLEAQNAAILARLDAAGL